MMLPTKQKRFKEQVDKLLGTKCVVCGFTHPYALQIDHVNNNGKEDRKKYNTQQKLYEHILAVNGEGYQVLCANCNIIKYRCFLSNIKTGESKWHNYIKTERAKARKREKTKVLQDNIIPEHKLAPKLEIQGLNIKDNKILGICKPYTKKHQLR